MAIGELRPGATGVRCGSRAATGVRCEAEAARESAAEAEHKHNTKPSGKGVRFGSEPHVRAEAERQRESAAEAERQGRPISGTTERSAQQFTASILWNGDDGNSTSVNQLMRVKVRIWYCFPKENRVEYSGGIPMMII